MLEITRACVMDGVAAAPSIVGRQCQYADGATNPIICGAAAEKCAVPAIVLDHEQTDEEACGRNGQEQAQPITQAERSPDEQPRRGESTSGSDQLDQASRLARFTVLGEDLLPFTRNNGRDISACILQSRRPLLAGLVEWLLGMPPLYHVQSTDAAYFA